MEISFVTSRLAVGSHPETKEDVEKLLSLGITHILETSENSDDFSLIHPYQEIYLVRNVTQDDGQPKPASWFDKSIDFVLNVLANGTSNLINSGNKSKVFIHCYAGHNRGPSTMYCVLRAIGFNKSVAYTFVKAAHDHSEMSYNKDADRAIKELGYE